MKLSHQEPKRRQPNQPRAPRYQVGNAIVEWHIDEIKGRETFSSGLKPTGEPRIVTAWVYRVHCTRCGNQESRSQMDLRAQELHGRKLCPCQNAEATAAPWHEAHRLWASPPSVLRRS